MRLCSTALLVILTVVRPDAQLNASDAAAMEATWDNVQVTDSPLRSEYEPAKRIYTNLISATYLRVSAKLSLAKRMYRAVLDEHEVSAFVHTQLASLSMEMQDIPTVERACHRAIELDPEKPTPYFLLGKILIQRYGNAANRDKWGDIIAAFQKVVEVDPDHYGFDRTGRPFSAYYHLGEISELMGDDKSAVNAFKELTRIMPYQAMFYLRLGSLYNQLENKQEAIAAYERAVKINRDLRQAHDALGQLSVEQYQKYEEQIYSQADLTPDLLGLAKESLEKAIHSYSELHRLAPRTNQQRYNNLLRAFRTRLGSLYLYFEKAEEALQELKKVLDEDPDHVDANYFTGMVYQVLGNFEQAESYLRKTIVLAPEREESYNALGYLFAEYGTKLDEAVELIQKALQRSPENGAYLDSLGWVYFKQGNLDAALTQLEKAVRYMPHSAEIQDHLGEVYLKKGLKQKAISAWQKAIQLEPDDTAIREKLRKHQEE
jgi:tetratricopeptide (TPR) repeat protein